MVRPRKRKIWRRFFYPLLLESLPVSRFLIFFISSGWNRESRIGEGEKEIPDAGFKEKKPQ